MEKKVYDKTRISTCCQAPVFVGGDDKEGTHYYVCEKCSKPCDSEGLNTDVLFRELDKAREEWREKIYGKVYDWIKIGEFNISPKQLEIFNNIFSSKLKE